MIGFLRFLALASALLAATLANAAERRVALVLGNSAYQNVPALENPVRDARAIGDKLHDLGFEVVSGFDLTKAQTQAAIAKFASAARGSDVALFYYAGHGMQVAGNNYMLPVDAALKDDISLDFEAVPIDFIWRQMSRDTKVRVVLLDACRDNPLARVFATSNPSASATGGLAEMQVEAGGKAGALIAFSTSPGRVAYDGTSGHSPFAAALLAHLGDVETPLTTVMTRVTGDVVGATKGGQRPWVNVSLTGEVTLNRGAAPHPAPAGGQNPDDVAQVDEAAETQLRRLVPEIDAAGPVLFDRPLKVGDPAIDGKSLAQLVEGKPLFTPIEGLDKAEWNNSCSSCHQWTRERLCEQSQRYDRSDAGILRLQHPYGPRFKVALANWAKNGCK